MINYGVLSYRTSYTVVFHEITGYNYTLTVFRMSTPELLVFKKHFSELQGGIQSPSELAGKLYSKSIIAQNVREAAQLPTSTVHDKITALLDGVERAISSDPQCFHQLMDILDDDPTTKTLHTKLMNTYCELPLCCMLLVATITKLINVINHNYFAFYSQNYSKPLKQLL